MPHEFVFFVQPEDVHPAPDGEAAATLELVGEEHRHLSRVVRAKPGQPVSATDGAGHTFLGTVSEILKDRTIVRVHACRHNAGEPVFHLTVAHVVPAAARYEWALEKCTELGAAAFWPLTSDLSHARIGKGKPARWQRLLLAAVKQSGRSVLPEIQPLQSLAKAMARAGDYDFVFCAHPTTEGANPAAMHANPGSKILLFVGPEAGFSEAELEQVAANGFRFLDLGPTRLRSETAAVAATSVLITTLTAGRAAAG